MTPPGPAAARTHACPGGCGRAVGLHLYACLHCWTRLPAVLRRPIRDSYRRRDWDAHAAAAAAGDAWLRNHPPPADGEPAAHVPAQPDRPADRYGQTALFDVPRRPVPTSDQLRVQRQLEALASGQHPLSVALGRPLALHPQAAPVDDRNAPGLRCGGCTYRRLQRRGIWDFAKCVLPGAGRVSRAAGTDVRAWWPACVDHQPVDLHEQGRPP